MRYKGIKLKFYRYKGNNNFQSSGEIESAHEFEVLDLRYRRNEC